MAISNHERVGKALDLLKGGLGPFIEREIASGALPALIEEARSIGYSAMRLDTLATLKEAAPPHVRLRDRWVSRNPLARSVRAKRSPSLQ
jgi:hypothetical protein